MLFYNKVYLKLLFLYLFLQQVHVSLGNDTQYECGTNFFFHFVLLLLFFHLEKVSNWYLNFSLVHLRKKNFSSIQGKFEYLFDLIRYLFDIIWISEVWFFFLFVIFFFIFLFLLPDPLVYIWYLFHIIWVLKFVIYIYIIISLFQIYWA